MKNSIRYAAATIVYLGAFAAMSTAYGMENSLCRIIDGNSHAVLGERLDVVKESANELQYDFVTWSDETVRSEVHPNINPYARLIRIEKSGHQKIELKNVQTNDPKDVTLINIKSNNSHAQISTRFNHSGFLKNYDGKDLYNQIAVDCPGLDARPNSTQTYVTYKQCRIEFADSAKTVVTLNSTASIQKIEVQDSSGLKHKLALQLWEKSLNIGDADSYFYEYIKYRQSVPSLTVMTGLQKNQIGKNEKLEGSVALPGVPQFKFNCN